MCVIAVALPLIFGVTATDETNVDGSRVIPIVFLIVGSLTLLSALYSYKADLRFYSENSIETDSGVELHVKIPGGAAGLRRLYFYYPFTFVSASIGVGFAIAFLW